MLLLFTVLPMLLGAAVVAFDRTAIGPVRQAEALLIPLLLVGIGGGGLWNFIAYVFVADPTARSIGWEPGSPFQLLVGFAHLAIGLLGAIAAERRDGFREATVVAATVFGLGAAVAPFIHGAATENAGPDYALHWAPGLAAPALLIWLLVALRRAEREPPGIVLRSWTIPIRRGSVAALGIVTVAFAVGRSVDQPVVFSAAGIALATVAFWWIVSRAPSHRAGQQK